MSSQAAVFDLTCYGQNVLQDAPCMFDTIEHYIEKQVAVDLQSTCTALGQDMLTEIEFRQHSFSN